MLKITCYLVYFVSIVIHFNDCARILALFPVPSISHQVVFRPLTQALIKNGHEVIVITPDPAFPKGNTPENLTEIDVHDISYAFVGAVHSLATGRSDNLPAQVKLLFHTFSRLFEEQIKVDEVKRIIFDKSQKFDLLLLEACVQSTLAVTHIFKVPVIQISSFGPLEINNKVIGTPIHPLLYPTIFHQRLYNLTQWEKLKQLYDYYLFENIIRNNEIEEDKMIKKYFGANTPPLSELSNNVDMLFLNTHPIWEGNRPVPPNVIFMGGLHQNPEKDLPRDLKMYLDSSKNGVIYVSFGTNVRPSLLPPETIQTFVKVFSKLPFNILWKFDADEVPGLSKNVRISKWLPQSDLLRHPKIKLFITQGGLQSTDEAITAGVPLIGIPMLADQWFNVEKYVYHNIGLKLDMGTIDEEKLEGAIQTIIENDSYRRNIVKLRTLMYDQPQRPLERAVWWTEHVLRHGGATHLRAPAANISWTQYLELELLLTLLITILVILTSTYYSVKYFRGYLFGAKLKLE